MNYSNLTLTEIACELQQGNKKREDEFWDLCSREVMQNIERMNYKSNDNAVEAKDLVQHVMIRVFDNLESYDNNKATFKTWLNAVTRNTIIDFSKNSKRFESCSLDEMLEKNDETGSFEPVDPNPGPEDVLLAEESNSEIEKALSKLPDRQRRVMELRMEGYTPEEISQYTGEKVRDVSNLTYRARTTLNKFRERENLSLDGYDRAA